MSFIIKWLFRAAIAGLVIAAMHLFGSTHIYADAVPFSRSPSDVASPPPEASPTSAPLPPGGRIRT